MAERLAGMRVALVLGTSTGGVGGHVRQLASGLAGLGARVAVLGPAETESAFGFTEVGAAFAAVEIGAAPRPYRDARAVLRLRRLLRDADIVHAHGLRAGLLSGLALRRRSRPLVVTWHNAVLGSGARRVASAAVEAVVARLADVTLGASSDLVRRVRELGGRDVRLGPVTTPAAVSATRDRTAVRAELGVGDRPLLLCVGRLAPQKGYPLLLDAAARWARRPDRPGLAVAGSGPLRDSLEHRARTDRLDVAFLGHRGDVPDLLGAADVAVLASEWEARSLFAQEALRAGVPLVATDVGGLPELVGDAALLVPYGDVDLLAGAVARVLDEPELAARLRRAGPVRARTWPDAAASLAQVVELYRELTNRR